MSRTAPETIMVSGWAFPAEGWQPVVRHLPDRTTTCPYGLHDLHHAGDTPDYAGRLLAAMSSTDRPIILAGWSTGALAALEAAGRRPANLAGLLLISATARFCNAPGYSHGHPPAVLRALKRRLRTDPKKALRDFYQLAAAPERLAPQALDDLITAAMTWPAARLTAGLDYLAHTDLRRNLGSLRCPTLIIHARDDHVIPPQAAEYLAGAVAGAQLKIVDRGGHLMLDQHPALIADALQNLSRMPGA